jgi:hypothetical protein
VTDAAAIEVDVGQFDDTHVIELRHVQSPHSF